MFWTTTYRIIYLFSVTVKAFLNVMFITALNKKDNMSGGMAFSPTSNLAHIELKGRVSVRRCRKICLV